MLNKSRSPLRASRNKRVTLLTGTLVATVGVLALVAGLPTSSPTSAKKASLPKVTATAKAPTPLCGTGIHLKLADGQSLCTHGDDDQFKPGAVRLNDSEDAADHIVAASVAAQAGNPKPVNIPCHGDGTSGNRIQAFYVYKSGSHNNLSSVRSRLTSYMKQANGVISYSAHVTHGHRDIRFYTNSSCTPVITPLAVPASQVASFSKMVNYVATKYRLRATNRKYLFYVDSNNVCGLGSLDVDSSFGPTNANNAGPSYARVDRQCWGGATTAHELLHTLGAVQKGAPHYDGTGHCTDDHDIMCYNAGGKKTYIRCHNISGENLADCGNDDYFSTAPRKGSYLATHWNTAMSSFLYGGGPVDPVTPKPPVSIVVPMRSLSSATVSWKPAPGSYVTRYTLTLPNGSTHSVSGSVRSYTVNGVTPGDTVSLVASNSAGTSRASTSKPMVPLAPARPTHLSLKGTTVDWSASVTFTSGFKFYGLQSGKRVLIQNEAASYRTAMSNASAGFLGLGAVSYDSYQVCAYNTRGEVCGSVK